MVTTILLMCWLRHPVASACSWLVHLDPRKALARCAKAKTGGFAYDISAVGRVEAKSFAVDRLGKAERIHKLTLPFPMRFSAQFGPSGLAPNMTNAAVTRTAV